jgi:hypothetical protein
MMARDESRNRDALDEEEQEERARKAAEEKAGDKQRPNPPYTTKHGITAPKFGSAGSGGGEIEPGPEKD